ncbi:MAG TPA: toll/interleukin-1 receptor domain-containing protein [Tahibacter sp.]|nr:toll/interleukin-1 receptor domain-containing protein [Tahibacter sp.]
MATTLFISYAHRDEVVQREVIEALQPLAERGLLDVWHDRRMVAGDDIFPNIAAALERARIVVLLVSEAFLGSEECAREMWRGLENRRRRGTVVVPVILRRCDWRGAPFGKLNALPVDGAPLDQAGDRPATLAAVAEGIGVLAENLVRADAARRRRRRLLLAAVAVVLLPFALWQGLPVWPGADAGTPRTELTLPRGVFVLAEIRATAPDGTVWNPQAEGLWRLPVPLLCFRQAGQTGEVCPATAFATAQGGPAGRPVNASHVATIYATMTGWNREFSVRLKNQRTADKPLLGQGECRFGVPCRLHADGAASVTVAELLVLPVLDATDSALRPYLQRCVASDSLLAQQWWEIARLAGTNADLGHLSYRSLAQRYSAVAGLELSTEMLDALVRGEPEAFGRDGVRQAPFRATLWRAAWNSVQLWKLFDPAPNIDKAMMNPLVPRLLERLREAGFGAGASDGCVVPPDES